MTVQIIIIMFDGHQIIKHPTVLFFGPDFDFNIRVVPNVDGLCVP